jgi:hypothetical protein
MSKYKIGDRVEYVVDGVVQDTGTVTRAFEGSSSMTAYEWYEEPAGWWAKWDSDSTECHFCENYELVFRKVESKTSDIEDAGWITNKSTTYIRPTFMFEFLMSDGTVRQGGINEVPGIDWNINTTDDGYPHVVKYRMIGTT